MNKHVELENEVSSLVVMLLKLERQLSYRDFSEAKQEIRALVKGKRELSCTVFKMFNANGIEL